jgi:hypothetical protein
MLKLMIAVGVPILTTLVMEQLPKTGVAEVPFAFQVEDRTLPPGTYSVRQANLGRGIRIENQKIAGVGLQCIAAKRKFGRTQEARLVFDDHGGQYSLSEIWFDGEGQGLILRPGGAAARTTQWVSLH